jgi:hypothetical protein
VADDGGSDDVRSGLRVDLGAFMEPTVFSNEWSCGTSLQPKTSSGRVVDNLLACRVRNEKRNVGRITPSRQYDWHFFEKRSENDNCETLVKRHGPDADDDDVKPKTPKTPKKADPPKSPDPPKGT